MEDDHDEYEAYEDVGSLGARCSNDPERLQERSSGGHEECRWVGYKS
jgi:hypothetical protein